MENIVRCPICKCQIYINFVKINGVCPNCDIGLWISNGGVFLTMEVKVEE